MRSLILIGLQLFITTFVLAQQGAVSGTVLDANTGEPLIGANVVIQGTATGTATDFEGKYQFQAEPGTYTISVSYIGYHEKTVEGVTVTGGKTTILDVALSDEAVDLGVEVVVQAAAIERTENAILLLQKNSDKIQDGISSQEISRLGAGTAAAALTKVTGTTIVDGKYVYVRGLGDRYSSTALNGTRLPSIDPYRNSAQLDLIPTNLLDNIIASKTFTPDLPGDFTGGYVNIKIKSLPERFTYGLSVSTSYNTQSSLIGDFLTFDAGDQAWLGYNDGTLDAPDLLNNPELDRLNVLSRTGATTARRDNETAGLLNQTANAFNRQFTPEARNTPLDHSVSFNIGNQYNIGNMPLGVLLSANYTNSFSHYENALQANYVNLGGTSTMLQENFRLNDRRSVQSPSIGGLFGLALRPSPNNEISFNAIYSHQATQEGRYLQGDYIDFGILAPTRVFQSRTLAFTERQLVDFILSGEHAFAQSGPKIEWTASYILSDQNEPDLRFFANTYEPERNFHAIATSLYLTPGHYFRELSDRSFEGKIDLTIPFLQSRSNANKLKFGGLYQTSNRDFSESIYNIFNAQGQQYQGDPNFYFGPENTGVISEDAGRNTIGLYISDDSLLPNQYTGETTIAAGYGMLTYQLAAPLKFIGGLRVETTDFYVESAAAAVNPNPEFFKGQIDEVDFLPAANLIFALNDRMNIRASYSNTIARPNMREIAPFGSFGFIGDPPVFGNPQLQRSRITNLDLRYEFFVQPGELFAVSGFYKQFEDPIVRTFRPAGNAQFTWVNTNDANLYGAELEFRKGLGFLGSAFNNFSLSTNLAFILSEVALDSQELAINRAIDPSFEDTRPFAGQSPFVANANLNYVNRDAGWDAILAFNYFGDRLFTTGVEGTPDIYERGRPSLDFSLSKKFGNFQIKLRGQNLLNPKYENYADFLDQTYIYTRYRTGREFSVGLSYGI